MKKVLTGLIAGAMLAAASLSSAQAASYVLEKPHTQILFFVNHLGFSTSSGRFLEFSGNFDFTEGDWTDASAEVEIQTASIEMNDAKWNDHMKNEDFFAVEEFPNMSFKSTKVEAVDDKNAKLHGELTILGVTKPVVLDVSLNRVGNHPFKAEQTRAGFEARTTIKRSDYGMKYGLPMVGDEVEIRISVEGIQQ